MTGWRTKTGDYRLPIIFSHEVELFDSIMTISPVVRPFRTSRPLMK